MNLFTRVSAAADLIRDYHRTRVDLRRAHTALSLCPPPGHVFPGLTAEETDAWRRDARRAHNKALKAYRELRSGDAA